MLLWNQRLQSDMNDQQFRKELNELRERVARLENRNYRMPPISYDPKWIPGTITGPPLVVASNFTERI